MPFNCSDSSCPASGKYNKINEIFLPGEIDHIPYENHSYVIPKLMKEKYEKDEFIEEDFKNNIKILGHYFKLMFLKDYTLDPTIAKSIFKNKFPNIDLSGSDINTYITTKSKEPKTINNDKIINKEKIFKLLDEKGNIISKVYDFQNENNNQIQKYIIIGKESMFHNIKNNKISQFFMDCTYKCVPPSSPKFKLMVLTGFDPEEKKNEIMCFYFN